MNRKAMVGGSVVLAMLVSVAVPAAAAADERSDDKSSKTKQGSAAADTYDELYARYLQAARTTAAPATTARDISWMTGLSTDHRARRVNDLVTIRVIERISATGAADSSLDKSSSANASVTKLFGLEGHLPKSVDPTISSAPRRARSSREPARRRAAATSLRSSRRASSKSCRTAISCSRVRGKSTSMVTGSSPCSLASCALPTSSRTTSHRPRRWVSCGFGTSGAA